MSPRGVTSRRTGFSVGRTDFPCRKPDSPKAPHPGALFGATRPLDIPRAPPSARVSFLSHGVQGSPLVGALAVVLVALSQPAVQRAAVDPERDRGALFVA